MAWYNKKRRRNARLESELIFMVYYWGKDTTVEAHKQGVYVYNSQEWPIFKTNVLRTAYLCELFYYFSQR